MKTVKIAIAALTIASLSFVGCKKGPDDPFLSLHTRKGRMVGDWKITKGDGSSSNSSGSSTWTYDGTTYTQTPGGSQAMTMTINFEKDGTYKTVTTYSATNYSESITETGTWNFTGKIGDDKNKDHVVMRTLTSTDATTVMSTTTTTTDTYVGDDAPSSIMYIDELKNKEIKFTWDGSTTSGSSTSTSKGNYVLTPQ